mgnify:CR=1 FL=1
MTITRMQEPRQLYGLGSLVKKITKPIKKIIKSDLGKAALIGAAAFGIPGTQFGGLLGRASLGGAAPSIFGKTGGIQALLPSVFGTPGAPDVIGKQGFFQGLKTKFGNLGMGTKLGIAGGLATYLGSQGLEEQEIEEIKQDPDKLRIYLKDYFSKLNPNASNEEIEQFVETNVSEYATGGRVGFKDGKNMMMASAPDLEDSRNDMANQMFGKDLRLLTEEELEMLEDEIDRLSIKFMATGGRVGLESGTPKKGLESLSKEDMDKFIMKMPNKIEYDEEGNRIERKIPKIKGPFKYNPKKKFNKENMPFILLRKESAMGGLQNIPTGQMRMNEAGTMERDYRDEGGFVPVGIKEKADDVPAMLSKNEFVMTADAVRGMGNGSIEKGAQRLYDQMKRLENKVV